MWCARREVGDDEDNWFDHDCFDNVRGGVLRAADAEKEFQVESRRRTLANFEKAHSFGRGASITAWPASMPLAFELNG
jgi:hypothetical protein